MVLIMGKRWLECELFCRIPTGYGQMQSVSSVDDQ